MGKKDRVTNIDGKIVDKKPRSRDSGPGRLLWIRVVWDGHLEEVTFEAVMMRSRGQKCWGSAAQA